MYGNKRVVMERYLQMNRTMQIQTLFLSRSVCDKTIKTQTLSLVMFLIIERLSLTLRGLTSNELPLSNAPCPLTGELS